jgi:uncharacterized repeat protein (TIGR02543 family)
MKYRAKLLTILLTVTLMLTVLSVAPLVRADSAATLVVQLNAVTGLFASIDDADPNIVNVVGSVSGATTPLTLNIDSGVTVNWCARYSGGAIGPLIYFVGAGTFKVGSGGFVDKIGSGFAINAAGANVVVTGDSVDNCGVVAATSGSAIMGSGSNTVVTVEGFGLVYNYAGSNLNPVINMSNPVNTFDNVFVVDSGRVWALNENSGSAGGYAIQTCGNVVINGGDVYSAAPYGRAINLLGFNSLATVNGGVVRVTGVNGVAISTGTTYPSMVPNAAVHVTGGIVSATLGAAIRTTGISSHVTVTGGIVSATSGYAINSTTANVEVSGGFVFANGTAITGNSNVIRITGGGAPNIGGTGVVVAWNKVIPAAPIDYAEGLRNDLIVSSGGTVWWHNDTVNSGISYVNGANVGFFPLSSYVHVDSVYGLLFDASSGKMYLDVENTGIAGGGNPEYFEGKDVTWIGTVGNLVLNGFSWTTSASTALTFVGQPVILNVNNADNADVSCVASTNNVKNSCGINFTYSATITGAGALNVFSGDSSDLSCGIVAMNDIVIDGGGVVGVCVNAVAGAGALESFGIYIYDDTLYGLSIVEGTVVAQGETSAFSTSPISLPDAYTYWTNTAAAANPGTAGTLYYPNSDTIQYDYDKDELYVKIVSERIIIVNDVTISGTVGEFTTGQQAIIILYGYTLSNTLTDVNCSPWFNNLPNGIIATANAITGEKSITLTFEGTPKEANTKIFDITIPANILTNSVADVKVFSNLYANFNIINALPEIYIITYHGNGYTNGAIPIDDNNPYESESQVIIMGQGGMNRTGYIFLGWSQNFATTVATYLPNSIFTITYDVTLYAIWTAINYTVTYEPGTHGTFTTQTTNNLHYGDQTPNAPTITGNTGWDFTGWSTTPSTTVTGNATYTAQWIQTTTIPSPTPSTTPSSSPTPTPSISTSPTSSPSPTASTSVTSLPSSPTFTPILTATSPGDSRVDFNDEAKWAFVNFFICALGIVLAVFTALYILLKNGKQVQRGQKLGQHRLLWLVTTVVLASVGVIVFLLTEDLSLPFGWIIDKWTILNTAILAAETITALLCLKTAKQTQF